MQLLQSHKVLVIILCISVPLVAIVVLNMAFIFYNGTVTSPPNIPQNIQKLGQGKPLTYAVLGDSTAVGQGGEYSKGIAVATAAHIAKNYSVEFKNFGSSGARISDVANIQVSQATGLKPDLVLISAGANDVTHFTALSKIEDDVNVIIDRLRANNPKVKIIFIGSPEMSSIPRFIQPTKYILGLRSTQVNRVFQKVISAHEEALFSPIAQRTGSMFAQDPALFAQDKFHPNTAGYDVWIPVLIESIDTALAR